MSRAVIALPSPPQPTPPAPFPLIASVAPVIGSLIIWVMTRSPFVLVFALLGPLVALAGIIDSRVQRGRESRRGRSGFQRAVVRTTEAIARAHALERAGLFDGVWSPASGGLDHGHRWRGAIDARTPVLLGLGPIPSAVELDAARLDGGSADLELPAEFAAALDGIRASAAVLERGPVIVDARLGIGVIGPRAAAVACAASIILQVANVLAPDLVELVPFGQQAETPVPVPLPWSWLGRLPHWNQTIGAPDGALDHDGRSCGVEFRTRAGAGSERRTSLVIAIAAPHGRLPRECAVIVRLGSAPGATVSGSPEHRDGQPVSAQFASSAQAGAIADVLHGAAEAEGLLPSGGIMPERVRFSELPAADEGGAGLPAAIGLDGRGPVFLDLIGDGPHAIVGGTTGSGKSELLVSWLLSLAAAKSPDALNLLLIDFKGGATFSSITRLPHSVGLITDLDSVTAERALASLRAELQYRERVLAAAGAKSIDELDTGDGAALARLVIAVDEFAAVVSDHPGLHDLFCDIAARGRSLGVHLVLCTQRPAGVMKDGVLANCAIRISLRVNNRRDSVAVIGSEAAADLASAPAGRAIVSRGGSAAAPVQLAIASAEDVSAVVSRWADSGARVRRPWLDPLPALVSREGVADGAETELAFGLLDLPEEQRQEPAVYRPQSDGNLLVIGGTGSGKTGVLDALVEADRRGWVERLPGSVESAWDRLSAELSAIRSGPAREHVLLIDDVDVLISRFPADHQQAFVELLTALAREGGGSGLRLAMCVRRVSGAVTALASLCDSRLVLRMPDRQEHALAGAAAASYDSALLPGGGHWRGHRVQVYRSPPASGGGGTGRSAVLAEASPSLSAALAAGDWPCIAVAAANPAAIAPLFEALGDVVALGDAAMPELTTQALRIESGGSGRPRIILGDPEAWQSNWGMLASARARMPIVLHGCSAGQFRALTGDRTLPPPITRPHDVVLLTADGQASRASLGSAENGLDGSVLDPER